MIDSGGLVGALLASDPSDVQGHGLPVGSMAGALSTGCGYVIRDHHEAPLKGDTKFAEVYVRVVFCDAPERWCIASATDYLGADAGCCGESRGSQRYVRQRGKRLASRST